MSKIYKIEAYIVDPNDIYNDGEDCFEDMIEKIDCFCPVSVNFEQAEFEWDDEVVVNNMGCTEQDCEDFLRECMEE